MKRYLTDSACASLAFFCSLLFYWPLFAADDSIDSARILMKAGDNAAQIRSAIKKVPSEYREGLSFLLNYMPERDLQQLSSDYLLGNVQYAYKAWEESPWKDQISKDLFFNNILPYVSINERRDNWRQSFYEKFKPLIEGIDSPGLAAATLNQKIFPLLKVKYSTKRKKADQSPFESMESGLASCTGLSIMLIDACRAVGIPARFVGTPLWSDGSGNHSWVEVYDQGWHFTGAAEPAGDALNKAWFIGRAAKAQRDSQPHAIYAVSFRHTPQPFPMVWKRGADYVHSVNVTDRYTQLGQSLPPGHVNLMFRIFDGGSGDRCSAPLTIKQSDGDVIFQGKSKDERFDANDHLTVAVPEGETFHLSIPSKSGMPLTRIIKAESGGQLIELELPSGKDSR
ncbi:transglutaminase-like domain-containing protein [Verrucomicrobia bacterium]|nr:transglutaminase-like domain-containing protein [Verrucomicrobiota bacterium]MDC0299991.1 transglutaminase-like domain-containing protein [Verrucomicrobiota bacterium]